MVLGKQDKVLIKSLCQLKGYNARQFTIEFPNKDWKKCNINKLLQKLRNDGTDEYSDLKQRLIDTWASVSQNTSANLFINGESGDVQARRRMDIALNVCKTKPTLFVFKATNTKPSKTRHTSRCSVAAINKQIQQAKLKGHGKLSTE